MNKSLPIWTYKNKEFLELEYENLILKSWQYACHIDQVKNPGDFYVVDFLKDSIIIIKDINGEINAFQNVCRHRAARLLDGSGQCNKRITCPYHGWSYGIDGKLKGVPSQKTFDISDKSKFDLKKVNCEIFFGFVFINISNDQPNFNNQWKEFYSILESYNLHDMEHVETYTEVWNCNWKVAVDNNLENYHVPVGHPGYHRMLDNEMKGSINEHGISYSKSIIKKNPSSNWSEKKYQEIFNLEMSNYNGNIDWSFFSINPNIGMDIYPDSMDLFQILPLTVDTCLMRYPVFKRKNEDRAISTARYLNSRINTQVTKEDRFLSERVQQGLISHQYEFGPLSDYENAIIDFHQRIMSKCPVSTLSEEPINISVKQLNSEMLDEN